MVFFVVFIIGLLSVLIFLNVYFVNFGDSIKIFCIILVNLSVINVFWECIFQNGVFFFIFFVLFKYFGGNVIMFDFIIVNIDIIDQGFYCCLVINFVGISISDLIFLIVVGSEFDMVGEIRKEQFLII